MKTFAVSDTHFGHANIIKYCNRPFQTVNDMNTSLIKRWNSRVQSDDTVYLLGDFAMGPGVDDDYVVSIMKQLNGNKFAVLGNHDKRHKRYKGLQWIIEQRAGFENLRFDSYREQIIEVDLEGKRFVMSHYPLADWHYKEHGSIHLHGHSHKSNILDLNKNGGPPDPTNPDDTLIRCLNDGVLNRYDIGVDMYGGPVEITGDLRYLNSPKGWE